MKYSQKQLEAVRQLAKLHCVSGSLSDEACIQYLDWQALEKPESDSILEAISSSLENGASFWESRLERLKALAGPPQSIADEFNQRILNNRFFVVSNGKQVQVRERLDRGERIAHGWCTPEQLEAVFEVFSKENSCI